ncbi:hypothetical protein ACFFGF_13495 [Asaia lannensis]|uniref:Uncharacterized protein n=1 Tax=Asaia lannensis NBRC 102526 TaxID=1307926 RepID=A0ABT1CGE0_9PROT|nr:hypothetical protein [Asaia lannensis]MCO6159074.1 hypothetical protein [Asaia lannensis NBRC 102526]GBQ96763.1 hypothetical protein AA102526_0921 [Asaia lannensis NBRC 102526]
MTKQDDAWFDADKEASKLERQAGIAEPAQTTRGFLWSIVLPCIAMGVFLICALWLLISYFHLLG